MINIIIQLITSITVGLIEVQRGIFQIDSLVFLVLMGFSASMTINTISNNKIKMTFLLVLLLITLFFPNYSFLILIMAPSAYRNFKKLGLLFFIPLVLNFHNLYFALYSLLYLFDFKISERETQLNLLHQEKMNLIDDVNNLYKSIDILKIEGEKDETIALQDERNRISREIHDTAGHTISASILNLKALSLISKEEEVKEGIINLKDNLENGLQEIRNVMYDLRDSSFDLENKILELLEPIENSNLTYIVESNLNYGIKYDLFGIIREALTNFIKHSNGKNFKVYLVENEKFIVLKIEDDGIISNFDNNEGMGIYSIKKKCEERNWKLNILTENGFGIHVLMEKDNENISSR